MPEKLEQIRFPGQTDPNESNQKLFSGDIRAEVPGGKARTCRVKVVNDKPQPITILGIFPEVDVDER